MSVPRKLIFAGLLAAAIPLLSSGCTSDEANAVVELCGDLSVPEDIDSVRVVIYDQDRTPLRQGVRELWACPGPTLHQLPQTFEFNPVEGDVFIEVQGLKEGAPVMRSELRTSFAADSENATSNDATSNKATVSLTKACMGARCAAGETCVQGKCELVSLAARAVSRCSLGQPDDQPGDQPDSQSIDATDASLDAGTSPDAQNSDAGHADAGSTPVTSPGAYLCPEEEEEPQDAGSDADGASSAADTEGDSP